MRVYIVQQGDTLWKIAKQHHVDFEQLKHLNSHLANPDMLMPGMEIFLPEEKTSKKSNLGKQAAPPPIPTPIPTPVPPPAPPPLPQQQPMPPMSMPPMMEPMMEPMLPCFICQMVPMHWGWPQMPPMHHPFPQYMMPQQLPQQMPQPFPQHMMPQQLPQHMMPQPFPQQMPQPCPEHMMPQVLPQEMPEQSWPQAGCGCGGDSEIDRQYYEQIRALEQQSMPMPPHHPTPLW